MRGQTADHVMGHYRGIPERSPGTDPTVTTDTLTAGIASTAMRMATGQLNAQTKWMAPLDGKAMIEAKPSRATSSTSIRQSEKAAVAELGNSG